MARRRQDKAWKEFTAWCRERRLGSLPAHPWTVAAYARWCERRTRFKTIVEAMRSIAREHVLRCHPPPDRHPTVTGTLRRMEARIRARTGGAALFRSEDFVGEPVTSAPVASESRAPRKRIMRTRPKLVQRRPAGS
jgi:hypothetical protein